MRQLITDNAEVKLEIAEIKYIVEQISRKQKGQDRNIELLFEYIDRLQENQGNNVSSPPTERTKIGYEIGEKDQKNRHK
ncbi:hypothetical protein [Sphingobacterium deserti]|nr:hypothetical protein [Sphingobacterium deserti]